VYGKWGEGALRSKKKPDTEQALLALLQDEVAGDPISGQQWIRRSLRELQAGLAQVQQFVSHETVRRLLLKHKISPKSNVKRLVPKPHPDRDTQFSYIKGQRARFQAAQWSIISVDTKKKELIGLFKNPGRTWQSTPTPVYLHDFANDALGRAVPYGIYDVPHNQGYIYVGQSADTPEFAVACITDWWQRWAQQTPELLILADGGGCNGYRPRRWKQQLQVQLADAFGLTLTVCHYPPGASKWNPIEHRLFSEISKTWAGTPLSSFELMLTAIRNTKTATGLKVEAVLVEQTYQRELTVSDDEMATLALEKHSTCPNWNYTIRPRNLGK
jgi:hypothetical protein